MPLPGRDLCLSPATPNQSLRFIRGNIVAHTHAYGRVLGQNEVASFAMKVGCGCRISCHIPFAYHLLTCCLVIIRCPHKPKVCHVVQICQLSLSLYRHMSLWQRALVSRSHMKPSTVFTAFFSWMKSGGCYSDLCLNLHLDLRFQVITCQGIVFIITGWTLMTPISVTFDQSRGGGFPESNFTHVLDDDPSRTFSMLNFHVGCLWTGKFIYAWMNQF